MQVELEKITDYAKSINVYNEGQRTAYVVGESEFNEICASWNSMLDGAHIMPAFGVSLNKETVRELKNGVWAEFVFGQELSSDGMPYEKLLVKVQPDWCGFNIIRYTAERGYDGRCFYYDLVGRTM
ncbi:MAG: hypothetical protein K2L72_05080, partial [Clostridia bacterium]|nr:hypothetical protein [Clostridia bacterium]